MVLPSCAFASPGRALIGAPLPDRFFISFGSLLYVCWLSENAALYLDCWTLFRSFQKGDAEAPRLNKKGRSAESSRCAWSGRQSRQGVRGVAGRVVGRVVKVCVEWPAESPAESSRCAWSGRQSRRESRQGVRGVAGRVVGRVVKVCVEWPAESSGESSRCAWSGRQSRRESRQGVRGVAGRVVGRVVKVCVEWPAESSGESSRCAWSGRQSRRESRQGVRGVAGGVVGRVVKVCVEWPAESSGESSRCAWSGRESRHGVSERVVAAGRCMGRRLLDRGIELRLMVQLSISSWNGAVVRFPPDSEEGHPIKC